MNISPIQNNNSQSFGMAFRLKGDGAKKLATFLEETNSATNKHVMEDLIKPIDALKTNVVFDGENVLVEGASVSKNSPVVMPGTYDKDLQYVLDGGKVYHVIYNKPKKFIEVFESHPLMQKLFNAREIAKDMDVQAAKQAYDGQLVAQKQARIEAKAKELQDLYG